MDKKAPTASEQTDFSLMLGGPLYQLLLRGKLMRPTMELLHLRIVAVVLVTWLPLAALAALGGGFLSGVGVPFLYDFDTHVRLLITVPLLIGSELIVTRRLRGIVEQFRDRELIAPESRRSFEAIISGAMRLCNSVTIEVLLLVVAFTGGYWLWRSHASLHVATWYAVNAQGAMSLTWAGYWYAFISLPIGRFILLRWYFRLFIWYGFLFRVSRLHLVLNPMHPDRAGGLGFLSLSVDAFAPVLIAQTAFLSGLIASEILREGATLPEFKFLIAGSLAFLMLAVLLPLGFFAVQMAEAKRTALREYGGLAAQYASEFRQKWLHASEPRDSDLLGSGDIQSLADLANSYAVVNEMMPLPFGRTVVVRLAILIALPLLPLTLTMVPFDVLLQQLVKVIM